MNLHGLSWTTRLLEVANDRATSPEVYDRFTGGTPVGCAVICDLEVLRRVQHAHEYGILWRSMR